MAGLNLGTGAAPCRRYVFDITDMIRIAHDRKLNGQMLSGVPRTLLQLAAHACHARPDVVVGYFDNVHRRYCELLHHELLSDFEQLRVLLKNSVEYKRRIKTWKYASVCPSYYYHRLNIAAAHYGKMLKRYFDTLPKEQPPALELREGDVIVSIGASWDMLDLLRYLDEEKLVGPNMARLAVMAYHVIPVQMEPTGSTIPSLHCDHWLHQICRLNAEVLVNTNSAASDLRDWCYRQGYDHIKIRRFPLGDEPHRIGGSDIRGDIRSLVKQRYVLMASSITGRKNGGNLIRAWRALAERIPAEDLPLLVIAGREGRPDLARCGLDEATVPTSSIIFVTTPNDAELRQLYLNCMFTVFPSLYEGWGLPVRESLWHGKICATSSCSSLLEVGGDDCEYFKPDDPRDIARVLRRLISDPAYLAERTKNINRTRLRTWRQAAEEMLDTLDAFADTQTFLPGSAVAHLAGAAPQLPPPPAYPG